jgi:phage shock protein C
MSAPNRRLYRNKANGKLLGVCAGLADYLDINPTFVRFAWVISTFLSFSVTIIMYIVLGLALKDTPYQSGHLEHTDPEALDNRLEKARLRLDGARQKMTRLEAYVTSDYFELQRKISALRR